MPRKFDDNSSSPSFGDDDQTQVFERPDLSQSAAGAADPQAAAPKPPQYRRAEEFLGADAPYREGVAQPNPQSAAQPQYVQAGFAPGASPSQGYQQPYAQPEGKSGNAGKIAVIVGLLVALLVAGAVAAYAFLGGEDTATDNMPSERPTSQSSQLPTESSAPASEPSSAPESSSAPAQPTQAPSQTAAPTTARPHTTSPQPHSSSAHAPHHSHGDGGPRNGVERLDELLNQLESRSPTQPRN